MCIYIYLHELHTYGVAELCLTTGGYSCTAVSPSRGQFSYKNTLKINFIQYDLKIKDFELSECWMMREVQYLSLQYINT